MIEIKAPFSDEDMEKLVCGDIIKLSGVIYTGRDAAHKRMIDAINNNEELPFELKGMGIYYVGPSPSKEGQIIGSAGPTTSYRMDDLTIPLLDRGLKVMIGKGKRSDKVIKSMIKNKCVYLAAIGGAGAYISNSIKKCEIIAYEDLGPEAIRKLELEGLVIMLPRKGAYVANISVKDLMDVLEIRASLEGLGASLAAERRNDEDIKNLEELEVEFEEAVRTQNIDMLLKKDIEFHECIFKAANNKKLEKMINTLWEQVQRFRITYVSDSNASLSLIDEHQSILNAIKEGNIADSKKFAIKHIEKAEQFMLEHCTK